MLRPTLLFLFLVLASTGQAQPPPPGGSGPSCWPPPCVPVDGGVGFLIAAGIALGAKKTYDFQKDKEASLED